MSTEKLLLTICSGNTCRSPLAAAILKKRIKELGKNAQYRVESAGLWSTPGEPVSELAAAAAEEQGMNIAAHQASCVTPEQLHQAERIFVMTDSERESILSTMSELAPKISVAQIPDPCGFDLAAHRACCDDLIHYLNGVNL